MAIGVACRSVFQKVGTRLFSTPTWGRVIGTTDRLNAAVRVALPVITRSGGQQQRVRQSQASHSVEGIFRDLRRLTDAALPTVQWWAEFRQRLNKDCFHPDAENWTDVVKTVRELTTMQFSRNRRGWCEGDHAYLLPPHWYPLLLQLASDLPLGEDRQANQAAIESFFWLLATQRIQFTDDLQMKAATLFEKYCAATDHYLDSLNNALLLGYPVTDTVWERAVALPLDQMYDRRVTDHTLNLAARYWALWLPGRPSAAVLHRLMLIHPYRRGGKVTCRLQLLRILIGDEFMPRGALLALDSDDGGRGVIMRGTASRNAGLAMNPELEQRLASQHGAVKLDRNVVLHNVAGHRAPFLLTRADGSKKVLRSPSGSHYRLMPADRCGEMTIRFRSHAYSIQKSGYEFGLAG